MQRHQTWRQLPCSTWLFTCFDAGYVRKAGLPQVCTPVWLTCIMDNAVYDCGVSLKCAMCLLQEAQKSPSLRTLNGCKVLQGPVCPGACATAICHTLQHQPLFAIAWISVLCPVKARRTLCATFRVPACLPGCLDSRRGSFQPLTSSPSLTGRPRCSLMRTSACHLSPLIPWHAFCLC